jgi:hypothetical protein
MPMKQGKILTGAIKSRVFCDISIAHKGKVQDFPNTCLYVWDTGRPLALSKSFLTKAGICDMEEAKGDYELLKEHGLKNMPQKNRLPSAFMILPKRSWRQTTRKFSIGGAQAHVGWQGEIATSAAKGIREKDVGHTTHSVRDAWTREKAEALRDSLREQMRTPYPALAQALEQVADEFPAAFGEDISEPSLLK